MDSLQDEKNNQSAESFEENPIKRFFTSKIRTFRSYWKTRAAVQRGEHVYDLTINQLRERNFLGPWTFNLYETFLTAIPTIIFFKIISLFMPTHEVIKQANRILSWSEPILIPLYLTIIAAVVARGSLKRKDKNPKKLMRAKYAYLYVDGAYGIVSQALMVFGYTLKMHLDLGYFNSNIILIFISYALMVFGGLHQLYITWYIVPQRLFTINGYNPDMLDHKKDAPSNSAPSRRFGNVVFFGSSIVLFFYYLVLLVVGIIILGIFPD